MTRRGEERREERETFGLRGNAARYQMRQKLVSIGDDFWIENGDGDRVFKVDGKALRARKTLVFRDVDGNELCTIQSRKLRVRNTMQIDRKEGDRLATVTKAVISPIRHRWNVEVRDGDDLEIKGNIVDHEYEIEADGKKVAEVSKKWFRVADTYGVEIAPDQNDILVLAVAAAVETMAHPGN